jgi:uncharacterized membrane protein YeaQ/YmgE (transglycosylase-associated protein family)
MDVSGFTKAIAGGIVGALVAVVAHFGFKVDAVTANAVNTLVVAVVGYVVGHVVVYFAPANK